MSQTELQDFEKPIRDKYEKEGHATYSSARLWDDGIILPEKTREVVGLALALDKNSAKRAPYGVFRM